MLRSGVVSGACLLCKCFRHRTYAACGRGKWTQARAPNTDPDAKSPRRHRFQLIRASRGVAILRNIYPNADVTVDPHANAVIVVASGYDEQGMRTIASGIDTKNPTATTVDTSQLKVSSHSSWSSVPATCFLARAF